MTYALFHNGKQVGKAHSTRAVALAEAIRLGVLIRTSRDFVGDGYLSGLTDHLAAGYEIREV
jgi:hypothetical protein